MNRNDPALHALLELRREEERQAGIQFRAAQDKLDQELARLETLRSCVVDYAPAPGGAAAPLQQVMRRQQFLSRLGEAEGGQQAAVARERQSVELARARWIAARLQREAVEKLLAGRAEHRARQDERREQARQDEQACRVASHPASRQA